MLRYFTTVLLIQMFLLGYSQTDSSRTISLNETGEAVEVSEDHFIEYITKDVQYEGSGMNLNSFVNKNLNSEVLSYLRRNKIAGKVYCIAMIAADGAITNIKVNRGVDPVLDNEVIRILKLTKWTPAFSKEQPIARWVMIPLTFYYN